ncbi:hypothetical protein ACJQWK_03474 [Exserohilum turcicum]|uniref:Uncharacterized protein n=1 Tax=Exserohilum turcicum (strain 28A) TaxID=671987 RepID=R0J4W1_EXST2|nr:uncharacterized protein SETTUDRAFT_18630 [Exserohilum turcica Et28A]EOA91970.1 hypothetical protein SETTUDRAFT_18630 [Exserohilum turcica Et28A]
MKLPTFVTLFSLSTAVTAVLEARQQCSEDSCYRAVYGEGAFSRVVQGVQDCEDYLTTSNHAYGVCSNDFNDNYAMPFGACDNGSNVDGSC